MCELDLDTPASISVKPIMKVDEAQVEGVLNMDMPENVRSALKALFQLGRNTSDRQKNRLPLVRATIQT